MSYLIEQEEKSQINWVVSPDPETVTILSSDSQEILQKAFEGDHNNIFLLKKTGFSMSMQIQTWINLYDKAIKENGNFNEVTNQLISKTIQDVTGFYFEYLTGQDIFPIKVEFIETESEGKTVYASKYNQTLEELTLPTERDGALAEGVKKSIDILINSTPETIVFLTSPKGKSGLGHDYPDNQTYVYWVNSDGDLDALTIRTDINLNSSEKLVGIDDDKGNKQTWDRLKKVVSSPKFIKANDFEVVLDLIEQSSGQKFDKQRREIRNRETLFSLNENASVIMSNLKRDLVSNISHLNIDSIKLFVTIVGKAILDLADEVLPKPQPEVKHATNIIYQDILSQPPNYYSLYQQVQEIEGCNGGGGASYVDTRLVMGLFSFVDGSAKFVYNCGSCGVPINSFISSGYQCSSCKGIYLGC